MTQVSDFITGLPKCELHVHIEGTLEPELKFELAARNGVPLEHATPQEVRASYDFDSLTTFLVGYYDSMRVLVTEQDFADLALAYLTKAASQNVRYVEMFFDPQAHTSRGVPFPVVIRGLRQGMVAAERDLGIRSAPILCFLRDFSAEHAMSTLMEALPYKDWILGVGLDSDERDNPPSKFAGVYRRARAEGFFLTMHCDIDQPGTTEHIRQALFDIRVDRIDHGTNALEDGALVDELLRRRVGLTTCPISNSFVTADGKHAEIARLLELGVKVTVNSDDPSYFAGYVAENLAAVQAGAGLSDADLVTLQRNAFEIAWLPVSLRARYLAELDDYAAALG